MTVIACLLWIHANPAWADEPAPAPSSDDTNDTDDDSEYLADDLVVVSGVRADTTTPATRAELGRDDLDAIAHGQEIPYILSSTPSIQAWGDTGAGVGYSYFSLRGLNQSRLDLTLNGVPLADMEDMGVYFSNFVDFSSDVESVQIQRGVGTSAGGTPSYGGAIHFESLALKAAPSADLSAGIGSFGTGKFSGGVQTGDLGGGWRAVARASAYDTQGWRDNAGVSQQSTFVSVGRFTGQDSLRIVSLIGREKQQMAYYAITPADLETSPTTNYMLPDEHDDFGQEVTQIQYSRHVGDDDEVALSAYSNTSRGWYDVHSIFGDAASPLDRYRLVSGMIGLFGHYEAHEGDWTVTPGFHIDGFQRTHAMSEGGSQQYTNYGQKGEVTTSLKMKGDLGIFHPYADIHGRLAGFRYHGDQRIDPITWMFLDPKVGLTVAPSDGFDVYASIGSAGREPTRTDMFSGEDNPSVVYDLHAVKPEHVVDVELGTDLRSAKAELQADVYAMEFHDEQAQTGEMTDIGAYLRSNVDRSFRRGVEVETTLRPIDRLAIHASGDLSWNRIAHWTQFYDQYDADFNWVGAASQDYTNVPLLLTPWGIGQVRVEADPIDAVHVALGARGVAKQFLDNTGDDAFVCPGYAIVDGQVRLIAKRTANRPDLQLSLDVDNVLGNTKIDPSGYSYRYTVGDDPTIGGDVYYFPQAPRSAMLTATIGI